MKNTVSIIIPCYNCEKTIARCLDSIINNTYKYFDVICVNDGSKDNTLKVLKEYSKKNKKIKVVDKKNGGAADARNHGLKNATGEFIMLIDSDDYIGKTYIEEYIKTIVDDDLDMVLGGYTRMSDNLEVLQKRHITDTDWNHYKLLSPWARIVRRKVIDDNNIYFHDFIMGDDVHFCMNILSKTDKVKAIDNIEYYYVYNGLSLTSTTYQDFKIEQTPLLDAIMEEFKDKRTKTFHYFMNRYVVYYLTTYGKNVNPKFFVKETNKLYNYLKENNIKYVSPFSKTAKGEDGKVKLVVSLFHLLYKMKLIVLFAKIYCKNKGKKRNEKSN